MLVPHPLLVPALPNHMLGMQGRNNLPTSLRTYIMPCHIVPKRTLATYVLP
jgi:hypothetical protein